MAFSINPVAGFSSIEDFKDNISAEVYRESIVGQTLLAFIASESKQLNLSNPVVKCKKEKKLQERYTAIFNEALEKESPALLALYHNGLNGKFLDSEKGILLLGPKMLRESGSLKSNFGILDERNPGAVFCPRKWTLLKNDVMMLSAIHAQKEVMIANPIPLENELFWKDSEMRMLGRELAILQAAGYKRLAYKNEELLGCVFICTNPERAAHFKLEDIKTIASSLEQIQEFLADGIPFPLSY